MPPQLIAQQPVEPRDRSRLMVVERATGRITHHRFCDLPLLLGPTDALVLNNTRVIPARLRGRRAATGGRWEGLYLGERSPGLWRMMCQTRGRPRPGELVIVNGDDTGLLLREQTPEGHWLVEPRPAQAPLELLARHGHVPLPPYVRRGRDEPRDRERYQTVFAEVAGAVAAPTAGLHFTAGLLAAIEARGIEIVRLTLHVGLGTFEPLRGPIEAHVMHPEWGEIRAEAAGRIRRRREAGGRVVAVGTTSVRLLETAAREGELRAWAGGTSIFIRHPHRFAAVDAMVTNFHLPRTTLLALVHAFAGDRLARTAYDLAVREAYRFYSFGDAMLIL